MAFPIRSCICRRPARPLAPTRWTDQLAACWQDEYDWDGAAARINALPHHRATIDGVDLHFLHFKGTGAAPQAPADQRLAIADAFDVVIPAHPGDGYSSRPAALEAAGSVELFHRLMTQGLGYTDYIVSGTDIGAGVGTRMALAYPEAVRGLHIAAVVDPPLDDVSAPLTEEERSRPARIRGVGAVNQAWPGMRAITLISNWKPYSHVTPIPVSVG